MPMQKKHGKGRLDKWYKLAKERGYRARAAFKLIQLNKKFGFLEKSKVALDLCAAPGSWCQVCAETMPQGSIIIGVDLTPIKSIPKVITFQSDITTEQCRASIRGHLKTWKADVVLHDGAPNVGTAWIQDSYNQAELVLHSLRLATDFLMEGGTFVTKVFRSKDYNPLLWVFKQLFTRVDATKPPSSRNVSAEIFVVCRGFKAPKRIDPRLLDPRTVFEDLAKPAPNSEAKVYKPEVKKRQREGYDEGDYTQFKEIAVSEFIQTSDPISILGQYNRLSFEQKEPDVAQSAIDKLPETSQEIRNCCADLKVLNRKDFKILLKWRLHVRDLFGFAKKSAAAQALSEEVAEVTPMDDELKIQQELQDMKDRENGKKKRERRRDNEKKQKDIVRMQMHMMAPLEIGMEEGLRAEGTMFKLKSIDQTKALNRVAKGNMVVLSEAEATRDQDIFIGSPEETEDETDEEEDQLERELDGMYDQFKERKAETDANYRAKKARMEHDDEEWEGVSGSEKESDSDDEEDFEEESGGDDSDGEGESQIPMSLIKDLDTRPEDANGLSRRAQTFFSQSIFQDIPGLADIPGETSQDDEEEEGDENEKGMGENSRAGMDKGNVEHAQPDAAPDMDIDEDDIPSIAKQKEQHKRMKKSAAEEKDAGIEMVKRVEEEDDWEAEDKREGDGKPNIDIITAEAMTLAHQLATGQRTTADVVDAGFNRHSFKDRDGLPDWFIEDESKHDKPHRPITKAAAAAIKEKLRAYNARPMKKVAEAHARKKFRAARRLEKLKKKADVVAGEEGMSEKEKATNITKLMAKAGRKQQRPPIKVVKAAGANRGISGRPRGVKGRYKMVDPRMKKELRAMKRIAARDKKR